MATHSTQASEALADRRPVPNTLRTVAIIGPPGAGKTAQAVRLAQAYGFQRISLGALVRQRSDDRELQRHSRAGTLVPDARIAALLEEVLDEPRAEPGIVIDGFPRTVAQARELERLTAGALDLVVRLWCDAEESVRRVVQRHRCLSCRRQFFLESRPSVEPCPLCGRPLHRRDEDTEEIARRRLGIYTEHASAIRAHYEARGTLLSVHCGLQQDELFAVLLRAIEDRHRTASCTPT